MVVALSTLLLLAAAGWKADVEAQFAAGKWQNALAQLNAIALAERDSAWHLLASKARDGLNQPAEAVAEAQEAIRLAPYTEAAHVQLAQIFLSRNTPEAAYEILTNAVRLFPNSVLVKLGLGLSLESLQRYGEAIPVLTDCLRLKPDLTSAFDALGSAYLNSSSYEKLLKVAADYTRQHPADFRGYYYQAAAQEKLQVDPAGMEALLHRSIELNPRFAPSYAALGKTLMNRNQLEPSAKALKEAIRLRPAYTPAHYYLASVYKRLGRNEESQREFQAVARLKEEEGKPVLKLSYHKGDPSSTNQK